MTPKIIITPKATGLKQKRLIKDLNSYLRNKGIRTEIESRQHGKGMLGGGIFGGIATVLTGGEGFFAKIGEALVQYVVSKKTELSIKNELGQEIDITSSMDHDKIMLIINNFFNQNLTEPTTKIKKTTTRKKRIPARKPIERSTKKTIRKTPTKTKKVTTKKVDKEDDRAKKLEAIRKSKLKKKN